MQMKNTEAISIRLSKELKAAAEAMAADEDRSVASLAKRALVSYLEERGKKLIKDKS